MNRFIAASLILLLTPIAFPLALLYVVADIWRCWLEQFISESIGDGGA